MRTDPPISESLQSPPLLHPLPRPLSKSSALTCTFVPAFNGPSSFSPSQSMFDNATACYNIKQTMSLTSPTDSHCLAEIQGPNIPFQPHLTLLPCSPPSAWQSRTDCILTPGSQSTPSSQCLKDPAEKIQLTVHHLTREQSWTGRAPSARKDVPAQPARPTLDLNRVPAFPADIPPIMLLLGPPPWNDITVQGSILSILHEYSFIWCSSLIPVL